MSITIINDCRDANARGRQIARTEALCKQPVSFIGVNNDLEASGTIIDVLDAIGDTQTCILVNVAPRNGRAKKWENGTPFGYFKYKNCVCVSTIDGYTLSFIKKLNLTKTIHILTIPEALKYIHCDDTTIKQAKESQFRSFDFLPFCAQYFYSVGGDLPHIDISITDIETIPEAV